jgi:hypothetical protein
VDREVDSRRGEDERDGSAVDYCRALTEDSMGGRVPAAAIGSSRGRSAAVKCRLSGNQAGNATTRDEDEVDEIVIEGGRRKNGTTRQVEMDLDATGWSSFVSARVEWFLS